MSRTTKVQMAIEDVSDWDDGTLEDYIVNLEAENKALEAENKKLKRTIREYLERLDRTNSRDMTHTVCPVSLWEAINE